MSDKKSWLRRPLSSQFKIQGTSYHTKYTSNNSNETNDIIKKDVSLKRVYKLYDLIFYCICNVIGSGIYVMAGTAGKEEAGAGLLISLIIGLFSAGIAALSYAEFSSRLPIIGGTYTYAYASSGECIGFILGLSHGIVYMGSATVNAKGAASYFKSFLETINIGNLDDTVWFSDSNRFISVNLVAPILIIFFLIFVLIDIKLTSRVMNVAAVFNITLLIVFIIAGFVNFNGDLMVNPCKQEYQEFFESECNDIDGFKQNRFLPFGIAGVFAASGITFWSFAGAESVCSVAEESKNPIKDIPRAIYITLCIVFVLFQLVTLSLFGMVPFHALNTDSALASAFEKYNQTNIQRLCAFGAFTTMSIILFAKLITAPRLFYRISLDGLLPEILSRINPYTKTPFIVTALFGIIVVICAMFFDLSTILVFSSTQNLINYTCIVTSGLIMRYIPPNINDISLNSVFDRDRITIKNIYTLIWSYFIISLIGSFIIVNKDIFDNVIAIEIIWYVIVVIIGIIVLLQGISIAYLHYKLPWKSWIDKDVLQRMLIIPGAPYPSLIIIPVNTYIIANTGLLNLAIVLGIFIIGFIIYILYGYHHSSIFAKYKMMLLPDDSASQIEMDTPDGPLL